MLIAISYYKRRSIMTWEKEKALSDSGLQRVPLVLGLSHLENGSLPPLTTAQLGAAVITSEILRRRKRNVVTSECD